MADKKELNTVDSNTGKLSNGLVVEYTGEDEAIKNSDWNKAAQKASKVLAAEAANPRPKFALEDGKVTVYGSDETLAHPAVAQMKKAISDAFKGKDLTDKDVATAFQKAIKEANNQIEAQLNYEEYEDFLKRAGFSDPAYRAYATARQEFKKPDVVNSTATVTAYDKNGKLVTKSIKEWFDYWKSEYNPEDRGQMWVKSLQAAYNPTTDEDLYKAIPALLMGSKQTQNWVQGFFQWINPFDDKGAEAPTVVPINGFDDTDHFSAGVQSAIATFGRILPDIGEAFTNPWENLGAASGEGRYNFKERFGSEYSDADLPFVENEDDFNWLVEMGKKYSDQEMREMFGNDRVARQAAIANDPAFAGNYQKFKEFSESITGDNAWNAAKSWDQSLQEAIERFSTYAPNAASTGVVAGTIARIAAEQMALSLVSGGALSASNIAKTLSRTGWKGVGNLTGAIKTGQEVAAKSSAFAKAINALAGTSAAGLSGASRVIYRLGKIGEFAIREVGEDALRGIVDDIVTGNSFDSQGNLDPDKFIENVYMNAVMAAFMRAGGTIKGGVRTLLDAEKSIDGVKLPSEAKAQLNELIEASSDTADSVVKAIDEDGHPIITRGGQDKKLDQITLTKDNAGKISPETAPTKTIAEVAADDAEVREAIKDIANSTNAKGAEATDGDLPGSKMTVEGADAKSVKDQLERKLNDDALRRKFTNGKVSINGEDYILDVKDANLSDLASANGSTVKNFADGVGKLVDSVKQGLRSYQEAVNGILAHMDEFASNWAKAVNDFAAEHNVTVKDVIIGLRDLRIDGNETIPGLKQLWEENWKPMADRLLDAQDSLTKIRTNRQDYYQRDMLANTINIDSKGNVEINQGTIDNILGTDKQFDLTASSRKGNRQKISDDQLETNPETLAKEFVLSRLETIKKYSKQGQVIATMREALDDGEELTQKEAAEALAASKKVGDDIRGSKEVKNVTEQTTSMDNVEELADSFGKEDMAKQSDEPKTEAQQEADNKKTIDAVADTVKGEAEKAQKEFDAAANKSNAAEEISKSSKYKNRAKAQANQNPIGVNYIPGNPFRGFAKWMNDNFVKSQSVQINDGKKAYSAYSGGYSLYAEAGSWARQVIINIRNGQDLTTALYNVISQNGIKIEPSDYAKKKYNAKTAAQKDMEKVSAIIDRITSNALYSKAVKDGKVVNTELLGAMITKSLRRQGAIEFMRFLKKADFTTFTKDQQKWLNSQAYKITASMDPNTYGAIKKAISKAMNAVMAAKYRSNMYMNLKNAQLQLTEIQRLFTLNKLGDFTKTVRRLITDAEFRDKVSDAAYVYADDSIGAGMSKQDLSVYRQSLESYLKTADASTVTGKGVITALNNKIQDGAKAAIDGVDNDMLGGIEAAEYFKNYMLLAGIIQSAESRGYTGATADAYIRNRFNTEALAGTEIGHIGLVDSSIGRLGFMYLGFPLRELTLQAHILKGGGTYGGTTKYDKFMGGAAYAGKMLGTKGLVWALEAPWGYKFADVLGYDPFGVINNRDETSDNRNVDPWMRTLDIAMQYNPFFQGAVTSSMVDVYMAYRESYEDAKDEWLETHDDLSGFEWNLDDAPQDAIWTDFASGYIPGYTAFSRAMGEASDLDSGYGKASSGRLTYEANQDPGSIAWGFLAGRSNTPNAREYYQTADPINDISRYGLAGLGRSIERALPFRLNRQEGAQIGWRNFREFDPIDSTTYKDWFDGSFADEQNWLTGYYAFREEAEEIRDAANQDVNQNNALEKLATRESQLTDLRERVERYVQAYLDNHPEGISNYKMQQIQRIFNMELPEAGTTLDRALGDYSDYEKTYAANRIAQGNFPNPVGMNTPYKTDTGEIAGDYSFAESARLQDILKTQQYGVQSDVGRVIKQLDDQLVATPYGSMSFKDFRKKTQDAINQEYAKSKVDYDKVADLQSKYLDVFDQVIRPIFATYGSNILSAGQSSDVMQQFTSMLNGLIPSDEYRVDKKGRSIRQSTPYMRVDIKKWLQKNYGNYPAVSTTDNSAEDRLRGIREDMDAGRTAVARAKVLAFIEDIREGRASVDRGRLEELQNILRGSLDANVITGGGNLNSRINQ